MAAGVRDLARGAAARPHPELRLYVTSIVGYHDVTAPTAVHYGVASASATLIVAFDEPLDSGWLSAPEQHTRYWSLLAGLHTAPALIRCHGLQHGIQVQLTPLGVRALLGIPAAAVAHEQVELTDAVASLPTSLPAQLAAIQDWSARFALVQEHLLRLLARHGRDEPEAEVAEAWRLLARSSGGARVEHVAEVVGWSRRRLAARFAAEFGVGPKQAARLLRLDQARSMAGSGVPLAEVAARTGYADQAHLTREWHVMAGAPPAHSMAHPYRDDANLQDSTVPTTSG